MIYKKVIGTLAMITILLGATFATYSYVSACAGYSSNLSYDGIVSSRSSSSLMMMTSSRSPIRLYTDNRTKFASNMRLADIGQGDRLRIDAERRGSIIIIKVIKKVNDNDGYDNDDSNRGGKNHFDLSDVRVISRDDRNRSFVVDDRGKRSTVRCNSSTQFMSTNFNNLRAGNRIHIDGDTDGNNVYAHTIIQEE
jgi:hypothetical protein